MMQRKHHFGGRRGPRLRRYAPGVAMLLLGYLTLAIPPETATEQVMLRVVVGFALLFIGFLITFWPLASAFLFPEDEVEE